MKIQCLGKTDLIMIVGMFVVDGDAIEKIVVGMQVIHFENYSET